MIVSARSGLFKHREIMGTRRGALVPRWRGSEELKRCPGRGALLSLRAPGLHARGMKCRGEVALEEVGAFRRDSMGGRSECCVRGWGKFAKGVVVGI